MLATHRLGFHLTRIGPGDFLLEPMASLDISARDAMTAEILRQLQPYGASRLFYDLAGMPLIDAAYYDWLNNLALTCRMANITLICVHMEASAAFALSHHLREPPAFQTRLYISMDRPSNRTPAPHTGTDTD